MSLKNILSFGRRLLGRGKKESAQPATGQQQKQITYEPKPSQAQGQELAKQEIRNPPVVLKKTKPLQMGDDVAPAFGSSTYDWIMRMGRSKYTADEWLDHLTSSRKVNFKVFGKPSSRIERAEKRFKYDSGPFAGKEVNISKEELFDTNIASFNEAGDLTGGLLAAAKKFGIKLDANELGAMVKLNPLNRVRPIELGMPKGAQEGFDLAHKNMTNAIQTLKTRFASDSDLVQHFDDAIYELGAMKNGDVGNSVFRSLRDSLRRAKARPDVREQDKMLLNKAEAELNKAAAPLKNTKTYYKNETNYTLQGGKDYRETIMTLPEEIVTNRNPYNTGGHFGEVLGKETNNLYHVRYDTRFTPDGKKVFMINEIQSDVNQSIAKNLTKAQQLDPSKRVNPFQKEIETQLLLGQRDKLTTGVAEALSKGDQFTARTLSDQLAKTTQQIVQMSKSARGRVDYFPMVEADQYGDHALKYLLQKAARENVDYVAVAPFDKLSFRQGYKAGNERFYGYASGKGINKSGTAVMPNLMKRTARFYNSSAGPTKISLSDPALPYKKISSNNFQYPSNHKLANKKIKSEYHSEATNIKDDSFVYMDPSNPNLYFDAFAIKVNPLMRGTQKTYKALGGLVVDIFKPMRYN